MTGSLIIGAGALGLAIGRKLTAAGHQVTYATRSGTAKDRRTSETAATYNYVQLDLLADYQKQLHKFNGVDMVYFCAAPHYWLWHRELVPIVRAALDIAQALHLPLIYADNLYAYGKPTGPLNEQSPLAPIGHKGKARKTALELVLAAHESGKVHTAVVQASDFYGPEVDISIIGRNVFTSALDGKTVYCLGNIDKPHSFTFIDDFADAMINVAADRTCYGQVWYAPCAEPISFRNVVELIAQTRQLTPKIRVAPKLLFLLMGLRNKAIKELREVYYLYDSDFIVNSQKYESYFGIKAKSLEEGIKLTVADYQT